MRHRPQKTIVSGNVYARQGSLVPYLINVLTSDGFNRRISLLDKDLDRFRNPTALAADLRVEKEFPATDAVSLTLGLDLFNALNESPVLARRPNLTPRDGDWVQDVLSPRVWRIGVRIAWR